MAPGQATQGLDGWQAAKPHIEEMYKSEGFSLSEIQKATRTKFGFDHRKAEYVPHLEDWGWRARKTRARKSSYSKSQSQNTGSLTRLLDISNRSRMSRHDGQVASDVSSQKIFRVGEVVAEGESDQVVVTTLADLFDVKKALSKGNSAQLIGSMASGELQHLVEKRYNSRFGALTSGSNPTRSSAANPQSVYETKQRKQTFSPRTGFNEQPSEQSTKSSTPSPNEMRKRVMDGAKD